jgi:hypothetical protein
MANLLTNIKLDQRIESTVVIDTTGYVITANDSKVHVDSSGGPITVSLPDKGAVSPGYIISVIDKTLSAATNNIRINAGANTLIDTSVNAGAWIAIDLDGGSIEFNFIIDGGGNGRYLISRQASGETLFEVATIGAGTDILKPIADHRTFLIGDESLYSHDDSGKAVFIQNATTTASIEVTGTDGGEANGTYVYYNVDGSGRGIWRNTAPTPDTWIICDSTGTGYCILSSASVPPANPVYSTAWYMNSSQDPTPVGTYNGNGGSRAAFSPVATQTGISSGRSIRAFGESVFDKVVPAIAQIGSIIPIQKTQAEIDLLPQVEGRMVYNSDEHNWELDGHPSGTHLSIGRELWERCKNKDTVPVTNGMAVFVWTGSPTNDEIEVKRAKADLEATIEPIIGLVTEDSIAVDGFGEITTYGKVRGINTIALSIGPVYVSTSVAGGLTSTKPTGAGLVKCVGFCTRVHANNGVIFVSPESNDHLADLHDVLDGTPTAGNMLIGNGFGWTTTDMGTQVMTEIGDATKELTGFDDGEYGVPMQSVVQMSFDVGTSTFTIAPKSPYTSYSYWYRGRKVPVSASKTLSCPFATSRNWWIVWDGSTGTLKGLNALADGAYTIIRDNCFVAEVIWNQTGTGLIASSFEAHGSSMSWMSHLYHHNADNTKYQTGGLITPINGTQSIGVEACTIWDEDIQWLTTALTQGTGNSIATLWRQGTTWDGASYTSGVKVGASPRPVYNYDAGGGNWTTAEIASNEWVNAHAFATPSFGGSEIFIVVGQVKYTSVTNARAGIESEILSLATQGLPFPEYKALASFCIDASATSWAFTPVTTAGAMIIDWRDTTAGRAVTSLTQDHGSLTGLADDDHTQYALRSIMTTEGDMVYRNATEWVRLPKGSAGQLLMQNSGATAPNWISMGTDATISETGAVTIANSAVTTAKIAANAVDGSKIAMGSDAAGDILYYNGTDYVRLAKGTDGQVLKSGTAPGWVSPPKEKSITVENPTNAENMTIFFAKNAITGVSASAVLRGSATPSVTYTLKHATTRDAAGTSIVSDTVTSVSAVDTNAAVVSIPAGSFVWLETSAKSGTVTELHVTFNYTEVF